MIGLKILDATCSIKSIWFQKNHPLVTYMDKRSGQFIYQDNDKSKRPKIYNINPDVVADWTEQLPFENNEFDVVVFDPPHIVCNAESGDMVIRYGHFTKDNWKYQLQKGIAELFRVLKPCGIFILKWCEVENWGFVIPFNEVMRMFPYKPLFGTRTGNKENNQWILFLKYDVNKKLIEGKK